MKLSNKIKESFILKCILLLIIVSFIEIQFCIGSDSFKVQSRRYNDINLRSFLVKVSNRIIKDWKSEYDNHLKDDCYKNAYLRVIEDSISPSFRRFHLYFTQHEIWTNQLPTYIKRVEKIYVVMYLKNGKQVKINSIPTFLTKQRNEECIFEDSWAVLYCDQYKNSLVVHTGLVPMFAIRQIRNFSCYKIQENSNKIKILEDISVDEDLIRKSLMKNIER